MNPQAHTGSYYAASANAATAFAPLRGKQSADVCVIGAGFTGISTALHLAERGYNVHVVEAHKVGWGASGRNGGQMIGGIAGEKHIAKHHGTSKNFSASCAGPDTTSFASVSRPTTSTVT
jgi:monoamine oxidase